LTKADRHRELVESYFDTHAQDWSDLYVRPATANDQVLLDRKDVAVRFLREQVGPGSRVLDAGCGAGLVSRELAEKGFVVHGIDLSRKMLDLYERHLSASGVDRSRWSCTLGGVLEADLAKGSFDGILALGFLQYQSDERAALARFHELLRPGGTLVVSGPIRFTIANLFGLASARRKFRDRVKGRKSVLHEISPNYYSLARLKKLLEASGFTVIGHKRHGYSNAWLPEPFDRVIGLLGGERAIHDALTRLSARVPIDRFANDIVVVAERRVPPAYR